MDTDAILSVQSRYLEDALFVIILHGHLHLFSRLFRFSQIAHVHVSAIHRRFLALVVTAKINNRHLELSHLTNPMTTSTLN